MVLSNFEIFVSNAAKTDIFNYVLHIETEYDLPITAAKIYDELIDTIYSIAQNPFQYSIRTDFWYSKYGNNVRRVNYKSRAIIYTIENNTIKIHRVVSQSEISD
jgi:hypothetical protein